MRTRTDTVWCSYNIIITQIPFPTRQNHCRIYLKGEKPRRVETATDFVLQHRRIDIAIINTGESFLFISGGGAGGWYCSCNSLPPNTSFIYLFMNMTLTVDYRTYPPPISSIPRIPLGHVLPTRVALYRSYGRYI